MSTDEGAARLRAESHAAAVQVGASIARKHVHYLTDVLTIVRAFKGPPAEELQLAFWSSYVREILASMHARLGPKATADVLLEIARETEEELRRGKPS